MTRTGTETELHQAIQRAAEALRAGEVVVIATETVYGLAAMATHPAAVERVRELAHGRGTGRPMAWHAVSPQAVLDALALTGTHRRLVHRLAPGPVTFVVELDSQALEAVRERVGVPAGTIDNGSDLAVRVPDHAAALEVLKRAGGPVLAQGVSAAGWGSGRTAPIEAAARAGITAIVDDGPTRYGRHSTEVRLNADGGWEVGSGGAMDERTLRRRAERVVLFVCTGNTCRSPMAETIARHVLSQRGEDALTTVESAGTFGGGGSPMSPEAVQALRSAGIEPMPHDSRPLTRQLVNAADVIFVMTPEHLQAVLAIDPSAAGRTRLLDPTGAEILDPVGAPQEQYNKTAAEIRRHVERRVTEMTG